MDLSTKCKLDTCSSCLGGEWRKGVTATSEPRNGNYKNHPP